VIPATSNTDHSEVVSDHYRCSASAQKLLNQALSAEAWILKYTPQVERYRGVEGSRAKGRRGGQKEPGLVLPPLLYLGKVKAAHLFLGGLEKVVGINRNLTHVRAGQITFIPD